VRSLLRTTVDLTLGGNLPSSLAAGAAAATSAVARAARRPTPSKKGKRHKRQTPLPTAAASYSVDSKFVATFEPRVLEDDWF